jgi:transcriptional regulator CtsR
MHLVNSIGSRMDYPTARAIIGNLEEQSIISAQTAGVMDAAMRDRPYTDVSPAVRDYLRANLLKHMLMSTL